jgi:hypothetical protein
MSVEDHPAAVGGVVLGNYKNELSVSTNMRGGGFFSSVFATLGIPSAASNTLAILQSLATIATSLRGELRMTSKPLAKLSSSPSPSINEKESPPPAAEFALRIIGR